MSTGDARTPLAVWSGRIMGIRVHVLDDGRRIIDGNDLARVFDRIAAGELDAATLGAAIAAFEAGETP